MNLQNAVNNKYVQLILVVVVVLGLLSIIGITFNASVGSNGISISVDRNK